MGGSPIEDAACSAILSGDRLGATIVLATGITPEQPSPFASMITQAVEHNRLAGIAFAGVPSIPRIRRRGIVDASSLRGRCRKAGAAEVSPFIAWLLGQSGIDVQRYRVQPLERRLGACLRSIRSRSVGEAWQRLRDQPELVPQAIGALLLGVTEFFRDPGVFAELDRQLTGLFADAGRIRVWSAACSSGAELYSVAILLAERALLAQSELCGTDCRADAVSSARAATYDSASTAAIPPDLSARYLETADARCRIVESIRRSTDWQVHDLLREAPVGPWDLILWRNCAIYLEPAAARDVWSRLVRSLRPGGILVTGRAERPERSLPLTKVARCIYRRTQG